MSAITPEIVLQAYAVGLFPMAETANDPVLHWIEPEIRGIIPLQEFHISHSLRKVVRQSQFEIRINTACDAVISACAERTRNRKVTWINAVIRELYGKLHQLGHCHSVETWQDGKLVGGLYGIQIGAAFCGESMFSRTTNASKVALVHLVARLKAGGFMLLDTQFTNDHLMQFGTLAIPQSEYRTRLDEAIKEQATFMEFTDDNDGEEVLRLALSI